MSEQGQLFSISDYTVRRASWRPLTDAERARGLAGVRRARAELHRSRAANA